MATTNKYKTLLSNTMLISFGTFASKLLVFLMVRFYTGYLTPSDYGTADLIAQTANLLFPIISLGITEGVFRFALDTKQDRANTFSWGFLIIAFGALLFFIIAPILTLVEEFKGFVWLIILYTIASCYHSLCSQYIRAIGKTALFAGQGIINTLLVILLNITFLAVFRLGILGYVLSVIVADTLCTVFLFFKEKLWRVLTFKPKKGALIPMLKYSIPLIPTTVSWWITNVSDRYMVNGIISSEANGIYAVAYKLPTLLTILATVFLQAWQFSAVSEAEGDKKEHTQFFSLVWQSFQATMFLAGAVVIALSKPAMKILTTEDFYTAWKYIPFLSIAMIFTAFASFMGTVYIVNRKSVISLVTALVSAGVNIILNIILIPSSLGVQGAAIATALSYMLGFVIRATNARKYIPFKLCSKHIIINTAIIIIQTLVMILELPYWILIQIIGIIAIIAVNFRFFILFAQKIFSMIFKGDKKCNKSL